METNNCMLWKDIQYVRMYIDVFITEVNWRVGFVTFKVGYVQKNIS